MEGTVERLKREFRQAMQAERHDDAERISTTLLEILTVSYRSDVRRWEEALELWHWARRTARAQRAHLGRELSEVEGAAAYGTRGARTKNTFFLEG